MLLQRLDTQRGGIAGGADRHCLLGGEGIRQLDQPFGLDASLLAETAPVAFADAPAVEDDTVAALPLRTVAGFEDRSEERVSGQSVSVRDDLGGRVITTKNKKTY